jgi:hypothetical protein
MTAKAVESPPFTIDSAHVFEVSTIQLTPLPTTRAPGTERQVEAHADKLLALRSSLR